MNCIWICLYVLSVVLTYFIQREYLKRSKHPECNPFILMFILMFIPIIGFGVSLIMLFIEIDFQVNYKKVYRIK